MLLLILFFAILFTCCWCPSYLHLPCNPLTGPGKRVCVESAASVDWPYFWLQAERPWSGACPQRLSLPDLRGRHKAGQHHRPFTERGMAARIAMETNVHFTFIFLITRQQLPVSICLDMCCCSGNIHVMHLVVSNCVTQIKLQSFGQSCWFTVVILESSGVLLVACTAISPLFAAHSVSGVKGQTEYRWWSEISCP